jgi:hypothetical protein
MQLKDFDINSDKFVDLGADPQVAGLDFWFLYLKRLEYGQKLTLPETSN